MISDNELAPGVRALPDALRVQFSRGSGPGGQNVNKVNTKAELWIRITGILGLTLAALDRLRLLAAGRVTIADEIHIVGESYRSQEANRADIFDRLRELIVRAKIQPKKRRKTRPSAASKRKRLESKRHRSEIKANRRSGE